MRLSKRAILGSVLALAGFACVISSFRPDRGADGAWAAVSWLHFTEARAEPVTESIPLDFDAPASGHARLVLFDRDGRPVATLLDSDVRAGRHPISWDGASVDGERVLPGVYVARLELLGETAVSEVRVLQLPFRAP